MGDVGRGFRLGLGALLAVVCFPVILLLGLGLLFGTSQTATVLGHTFYVWPVLIITAGAAWISTPATMRAKAPGALARALGHAYRGFRRWLHG